MRYEPCITNELQALLDTFTSYYNTRRPHRSLPHRQTPAVAYHARPKAIPGQPGTASHDRVRADSTPTATTSPQAGHPDPRPEPAAKTGTPNPDEVSGSFRCLETSHNVELRGFEPLTPSMRTLGWEVFRVAAGAGHRSVAVCRRRSGSVALLYLCAVRRSARHRGGRLFLSVRNRISVLESYRVSVRNYRSWRRAHLRRRSVRVAALEGCGPVLTAAWL